MRTRAGRNAEVLAQFEIDGRIDWDWCKEIPSRAAAAKRLVAAGRIRTERDESLLARYSRVAVAWWNDVTDPFPHL